MPGSKKFDPSTIAEFCKTHTISEATQKFKCSTSTARNACAQYGVEMITRAQQRRRDIADWVKDNNATVSEAASQFSTSRTRVLRSLTDNGVTPKQETSSGYKTPVSLSNFEIVRMVLCGYRTSEIVDEHAVSRERVAQIIRAMTINGLWGRTSFIQIKPDTPSEQYGDRTIYSPDLPVARMKSDDPVIHTDTDSREITEPEFAGAHQEQEEN